MFLSFIVLFVKILAPVARTSSVDQSLRGDSHPLARGPREGPIKI